MTTYYRFKYPLDALFFPFSEPFKGSLYGDIVKIDKYDINLSDLIETDEAGIPVQWSTHINHIKYSYTDFLSNQIRARYAMFNRPVNGLHNVVIDNYFPKLFNLVEFQSRSIPKLPSTAVAISPWVASYFGVRQLQIDELIKILGYRPAQIKQLLLKVKSKKYSIVFVGYGGTNVNTIHWLTELCKLTKTVNLFDRISVFEPEHAELSNLFRFPKCPTNYQGRATKTSLLDKDELHILSTKSPTVSNTRHVYIDQRYRTRPYTGYIRSDGPNRYIPDSNVIFYGAPGLEYRESLSKHGHFISATHAGNSASLWLNPTIDTDVAMETYGLIQLTPFFMNQLQMAISFLEIISEDIDLMERDKQLMEFSFDGIPKLPMQKKYNFQLGHSGLVATEEQANADF